MRTLEPLLPPDEVALSDVDHTVVSVLPQLTFAELYAAHQVELLRFATLVSGDPLQAEDIVAEVFAKAYPNWRRGHIDNPSGYFHRAVVNETRSSWRKATVRRRYVRRRRRQMEGSDVGDVVADQSRVSLALAELTENQRAVVVLRYFEDRSEKEIADLLNMPQGTVKSTCSRALERLQHLLDEELT